MSLLVAETETTTYAFAEKNSALSFVQNLFSYIFCLRFMVKYKNDDSKNYC